MTGYWGEKLNVVQQKFKLRHCSCHMLC